MTRPPIRLNDQIDIVERRVRLEKSQLSVAIRGLRGCTRAIVTGYPGLAVIFLSAAVMGVLGGRKLATRGRAVGCPREHDEGLSARRRRARLKRREQFEAVRRHHLPRGQG